MSQIYRKRFRTKFGDSRVFAENASEPKGRTMDLKWVIAAVLLVVVAFFAYQWMTVAATKKPKMRAQQLGAAGPTGPVATAPVHGEPQREQQYPDVAGQSEADLRQREPLQRPNPPSDQQPVTADGKAPAEFTDNLRRPEQSFHEPGPPPTLKVTDVPAGRAVESSGQGFSPELAQNDGPMVGNSVFAFDGMEPTGFANF